MEIGKKDNYLELLDVPLKRIFFSYLTDPDEWCILSTPYDESWYLEDCFFDEDEENFTV